jgi:hypothetical protein
VLQRTVGEYKAEGSIVLAQSDHQELIQRLGGGFFRKSFVIVISYQEEGMPLVVNTLKGCRITKNDGGSSQGSDANMVTLNLAIHEILWNGVSPIFSGSGSGGSSSSGSSGGSGSSGEFGPLSYSTNFLNDYRRSHAFRSASQAR